MIKIEITDLNALDAVTLRETGRYFMALAGHEEPAPVAVAPTVLVPPAPSSTISPPPIPAPPIPDRPASEVFKKADLSEVVKASELDVDGFPWDSRIHARTKTKTKDGRWKKIRGVGLEVVKKVENELKTVQDIPAPPVPTAPTDTPLTFADLMTKITRSITDGVLKRDQVVEVLKPLGIPSLPVLSTRLDLIPAVVKSLDEVINAA